MPAYFVQLYAEQLYRDISHGHLLRALAFSLLYFPLLFLGVLLNQCTSSRVTLVWDLDQTLIKSTKLNREGNVTLNSSITGREGPFQFTHVDDDLIAFRTILRPYTRVLLAWTSLFCNNLVFTSASRGYMINILAFIDPHGQLFYPNRLSVTDCPTQNLRGGKDVALLVEDLDYSKVVLIDDKIRYHKPQPSNGILIKTFDELSVEFDSELLPLSYLILQCAVNNDVRVVLESYHTPAYLEGIAKKK